MGEFILDIFSKRLKELREEHRYSQYDIAEKLGVSQSYYAKFELNKGEPNLEIFLKIADLFNVSADYLLGRELNADDDLMKEQLQKFNESLKKVDELKMEVEKIKQDRYMKDELYESLSDKEKQFLADIFSRLYDNK